MGKIWRAFPESFHIYSFHYSSSFSKEFRPSVRIHGNGDIICNGEVIQVIFNPERR